MAEILKFIPPDVSFDPDSAATLVAAYDKAIVDVGDNGSPAHQSNAPTPACRHGQHFSLDAIVSIPLRSKSKTTNGRN